MEIIKSPLNYSGSKNYIVDQIIENLPNKIDTFVDIMGGAFNVGINVRNAKTLVYNEYNPFVFEIIDMLLTCDKNKLIEDVKNIVEKFNLSKGDKEAYINFRNYYNAHKTPLNLFVVQMYCFQNQLRFNSRHDFNTPVGNCGVNETTYERILQFVPQCEKLVTLNKDFADICIEDFLEDTVFYFDPPYLITNATYNDGKRGFKGWDEKQEDGLLEYLDKINKAGRKFMLSNVIYHNGKTNTKLLEWCNNHSYRIIELKPHNGRYGSRKEVLVVNY